MSRFGHLSILELYLLMAECRDRLAREWARGAPGESHVIYDLAMANVECEYRGIPRRGSVLPDQLAMVV